LPGGGRTTLRRTVGPVQRRWVSAGGPLADLAGLVVAITLVWPALDGRHALRLPGEALVMIAVTQVERFLRNVVPRHTHGQFNDGGRLLLRAGRADSRQSGRTPFEEWDDKVQQSNLGNPEPAQVMMRQLLAGLQPGTRPHRDASALLAVHLARSGHFDEAVTHLETAAGSAAADADLRRQLRSARAEAVLSGAVLSGAAVAPAELAVLRDELVPPSRPEHLHALALLHLADGNPLAAARDATAALQAAPALAQVDRAAVVATVVIALAGSGDQAQARQWLADIPAWSAWRPAAQRALSG
jgi:hypothetical protein